MCMFILLRHHRSRVAKLENEAIGHCDLALSGWITCDLALSRWIALEYLWWRRDHGDSCWFGSRFSSCVAKRSPTKRLPIAYSTLTPTDPFTQCRPRYIGRSTQYERPGATIQVPHLSEKLSALVGLLSCFLPSGRYVLHWKVNLWNPWDAGDIVCMKRDPIWADITRSPKHWTR